MAVRILSSFSLLAVEPFSLAHIRIFPKIRWVSFNITIYFGYSTIFSVYCIFPFRFTVNHRVLHPLISGSLHIHVANVLIPVLPCLA